MAWIEKNRTKREGFNVRWRGIDGRNRKRWAELHETAKELKRDVEAALSLGREWTPPDAPGEVDLEACFRGYLKAMQRKLKENTLEQRDIACVGFLRSLKRHHPRTPLMPPMLTTMALEDFFDDLRETCSESTANARVRMLEHAWRWLANSERFGDAVPRPRTIELRDAGAELAPTVFTWEEVDLAVDAANYWYRDLFTVMRYTGLRLNQVMRLKWSDFDLSKATLRIRPELGKSKQERKGRIVPVTEHLIAEISGWGRREGLLINVNRVRPRNEKTTREPGSRVLRAIWIRALGDRAAELRQPTHCFRKTLISELNARSKQPDLVSFLVGHSRGVSGDVYNNDPAFLLPHLREVVALIPPIGAVAVRPVSVLRPEHEKLTG